MELHTHLQDMARGHGFHFLVFEEDTFVTGVVRGAYMNELDADTSLERTEVGENADGDDVVVVHSTHWYATALVVDAVHYDNFLDVVPVVVLPGFAVLEASLDTSNHNRRAVVLAEVAGFEYSSTQAQLWMGKTLEWISHLSSQCYCQR